MAITSASLIKYPSANMNTAIGNDGAVLVNKYYVDNYVSTNLPTTAETEVKKIVNTFSGNATNGVITHNLNTSDLTVQVYERSGAGTAADPYVWTPVMMNFVLGDGTGANTTTKIKLFPPDGGGTYRAVIVAVITTPAS